MNKAISKRSLAEQIFLFLFIPVVVAFYSIYKYPQWFGKTINDFYFLGKAPGFWYALVYTGLTCLISLWVVFSNNNPYWRAKQKKPIDNYQRNKFISIFLVQLFIFFLIPYVFLPLFTGQALWPDSPGKVANKTAHVYMFPAFQSLGMAIYLFGVIPLLVYFFGKRYCSWFCSCGNLAEAVGVTEWGTKWVKEYTPRGETSKKMEWIQIAVMLFSFIFGIIIVLDGYKLFGSLLTSPRESLQSLQDLTIDFLFGSVLGIGLYPFLGTRIWCRFGCPLARWMQYVGTWTKSKFAIVANDKCRGLNLCSAVCPMGIDVASYAHKDKQPINGSFGLKEEPCIGCGGCISICPVEALTFKKL